ncbi:MAG: hypothetical protein ACPGFA_01160 [Pikeienuella sp.]
MTDTTALKALLAKVEAGDTPSRQLDGEIDALLRIGSRKLQSEKWAWTGFPNWAAMPHKPGHCQLMHSDGSGGVWWESLRFTTSTDAALSLLAAVLPGWTWLIRAGGIGDQPAHREMFFANIWRGVSPNEGGEPFEAWSETPARALLIAALKALVAIAEE